MVITSFNNSLCRGITVGAREPDADYEIYFFDYGNTGNAPVASVDRPSEFWDCSAQAIPCILPANLNEIERNVYLAQLSCYESSRTVLNNIEFVMGPEYPTQIRDYVSSNTRENYAYTLNINSIFNQ